MGGLTDENAHSLFHGWAFPAAPGPTLRDRDVYLAPDLKRMP